MPERFIVNDDRDKELRKIEIRMTIPDAHALENVFKKLYKLCENVQPVIPNFTPGEMELIEELWKSIKSIR